MVGEMIEKLESQEQIAFLKTQDTSKLQYSLLPEETIQDIIKVFMFGAKKYAPDNWKECKDSKMYYDATKRHIAAWKLGEYFDKESNLPHLSHALCSLIILHWLEQAKRKDTNVSTISCTSKSNTRTFTQGTLFSTAGISY